MASSSGNLPSPGYSSYIPSPAIHPLAVLYGSETGTAQEVAEYATAMARRRGFDAYTAPLGSVPVSSIAKASLVVFVVSTTGDGEVPNNMSAFWRLLLRRSLPADLLDGVRFAVFGLGDSSYEKYNAAARKLHARLLQLGASELTPVRLNDLAGCVQQLLTKNIITRIAKTLDGCFSRCIVTIHNYNLYRGFEEDDLMRRFSESVPRGLGDDQSPRGMWGDLDPWISSLWSSLLKLKPLPEGTVVDDTPRLEPAAFSLTVAQTAPAPHWGGVSTALRAEIEQEMRKFWGSMAPAWSRNHSGGGPLPAHLLVNRRLTTEDHFQDVRHLELDVTGVQGGSDYRAGDVAWLHPCNDASMVAKFAMMMNIQLDDILRVTPSIRAEVATEPGHTTGRGEALQQPRDFVPAVCSVRRLLGEVLDILGTPRRAFFERLSLFASNEDEREKLVELASPEGADLLYEYATREKRTYVEVFEDFPSCKVPPERLLELIPRLRARGFSIASSGLETPSRIHLCVAVVSFRTPYKRIRKGVCSSWLASLEPGADVPLSIRRGTFKLPESCHQPLIMVGPGTGVAPMRSIILERRRQRAGMELRRDGEEPMGEGGNNARCQGADGSRSDGGLPDTLFFGCRYKERDFLYQADWSAMCKSGDLSLHTAFSRQNPDPKGGRVYVHHRIREEARLISRLIVERKACVLVSGSAKQMPRDVREALRDVVATHQEVGGQPGAEALLKAMNREGRYSVEAWS